MSAEPKLTPEFDCPPCVHCASTTTRPRRVCTRVGLVDGPSAWTIYCSACARGWIATPEQDAQAEAAERAFEAKEAARHG